LQTDRIIKEARKLQIADEIKIRNLHIYEEYRILRREFISYEKAIEKLAYKYYLSGSSIEKIVQARKNK